MAPFFFRGARHRTPTFRRPHLLALAPLLLLLLAGCSQPAQDPTPSAPPATEPVLPSPAPPTPAPAPTATAAPPTVVLLASSEADPDLAARTQTALDALAEGAGWQVERRASLAAPDLTPEVRLVVALPPDPGLAALAATATDRPFVAIGIPGLTATDNLSLIGPLGLRLDRQAFLAGYLAAVITEDWRVGVLGLADGPSARSARLGFVNGAVFFCGLCRPALPPFESYPASAQVPGGGSSVEWQAAADQLVNLGVETFYLAPGAQSADLLAYLGPSGVRIIGSARPGDKRPEGWVAAILPDPGPALTELWPGLQAGQAGRSLPLAWVLSDVNPDQISPGRARLVEELITDLRSGLVDSGVDPLSGERR